MSWEAIRKAFILTGHVPQGTAPLPQRYEQAPDGIANGGRVNAYPQYAGSGVTMGALSQQVGTQQDAMGYGLGSDPSHFYAGQDQQPPYDIVGMDAMEGVYTDARDATLQQSDMYQFDPSDNDPEAASQDFGIANEYPGGDPLQPGATEYNYPLGTPYRPGDPE